MRKKMFFVLTLAGLALAAVFMEAQQMATEPTSLANPTIQMGQWPPPECGLTLPCRG